MLIMQIDPKSEKGDLLIFALCVVIVPLVWLVFLGWTPGFLISSGDGLTAIFPIYDAGNLSYRADILGGVVVKDIYGTSWVFQLLKTFGFSTKSALNISTMFIQVLLGFIGTRTAIDLYCLFSSTSKAKMSVWILAGLAILFSFVPMVGWRIITGHFNYLYGMLFFPVVVCLLVAAKLRDISITCVVILVIALAHAFPSGGQQIIIYSAVFGFPLLLGLYLTDWKKTDAVLPVLVIFGAFFLVFPEFWGLLMHATGPDSARSLSDKLAVYSYLTSTPRDWLSSLSLGYELISSERPIGLRHEVNYPLGPIVLLLFLTPWRAYWKLGAGLGLGVFLAVCFSMKVAGVSDLLLTLVPPLNSFRVPSRAIIPLLWMVPIIAAASLLTVGSVGKRLEHGQISFKSIAGYLILAAVCYLAPAGIREFLLVGLAVFLIVKGTKLSARSRKGFVCGFVFILGLSSVAAIKERLPNYTDPNRAVDELADILEKIRSVPAGTESPLTRVVAYPSIRHFNVNTPAALELSSLNGYWFPSERFLKLYSALENVTYNPHTMVFNIGTSRKSFPILRNLYNICCELDFNRRDEPLEFLGSPTEPAWFSAGLTPLPDFSELARVLRDQGYGLAGKLKSSALYVSNDPNIKIHQADLTKVTGDCSSSKVESIKTQNRGQVIDLKVTSAADCPLSIATNYVTHLKAYSIREERIGKELPIFPVYGALTGVLVPKGTHEIRIRYEKEASNLLTLVRFFGLILIVLTPLFMGRISGQRVRHES